MGRTNLSVVLIIVCAVKCLAITNDDLEDFAEYLKNTSQLSPTSNDGVLVYLDDDYDDDEVMVPDHAWEMSGKFEGDLILNEHQRSLILEEVAKGLVSRNGVRNGAKRWPNNEVIFHIQVPHFTSEQVQAIRNGMEELTSTTCIKFRPYRKGDRDAVVIQGTRDGCFSQVGYQGGYQMMNLSGRNRAGTGCFQHGTVTHELLHVLGFFHMHTSPERDDYIDIVWDNILQQKNVRFNFMKYDLSDVSTFGVGYDYDSCLHYHRLAFSSNGRSTIVPKKGGSNIGQREGLSEKDAQRVSNMYCDAKSDKWTWIAENPSNNTKKKKPFTDILLFKVKAVVI